MTSIDEVIAISCQCMTCEHKFTKKYDPPMAWELYMEQRDRGEILCEKCNSPCPSIARFDEEEEQEPPTNGTNSSVPISVLQAKRKHTGTWTILGKIVTVSDMYVIEVIPEPPETEILYKDAKSIQLEDIEKLDENERLDVILYNDDIVNVIAGEIVQIVGNIELHDIVKAKKQTQTKIKRVVVNAASIKYVNRKEFVISDKDKEAFKKFTKLPNTVGRLVSMMAPNVYGHDAAKLGILRSIVGGIEKNGRRGRINTLLVGDPGTAKSKLGRESVDIKPNSRYVTAQNTSGKSLTAIIDKEADTLVLRLGPVALAKNAICIINEITAMSLDDQKMMLDVLEEGRFTKGGYGVFRDISAPTTIIATANPIQHSWNDKQKISNDEIWMVKPLLERFDQICSFRDNFEEEQCKEYTDFHDMLIERRLHNHNFLRKYLIHASKLQVTISDDAKYMLNTFWIKAKTEGKANNRMLDSLFRIAEAQAKLQLKNEVDDKIAMETMESVQLMMIQYGETIKTITTPKIVTYKKFLEILQNTTVGIDIRELCKIACKEDQQIAAYLGNNWTMDGNIKIKVVVDMLRNHNDVKQINSNPVVLQWIGSVSDSSDTSDTGVGLKMHFSSDGKSENETKPISELSEVSDRNQKPMTKPIVTVTLSNLSIHYRCLYNEISSM